MEEVAIEAETLLYRCLYPAQAGDGPDGPKTVVSANAFKLSKEVLQEISVQIAGVETRNGPMTAELCAFWLGKPQCGAGVIRAGDAWKIGFKVTHTVLPGESEAHALLESREGPVTRDMVKNLAGATKVLIPPNANRETVPSDLIDVVRLESRDRGPDAP